MIDYEKLKLAHELMQQLADKYYLSMFVRKGVEYTLCPDDHNACDMDFDSLDLLIKKLQELTQPKPKYKVGQELWFIDKRQNVVSMKIEDIDFDIDKEPLYIEDGYGLPENAAYPTKKELLESQLIYWSSLMEKEEMKTPSCSESIRKHHELEDHSEDKREKVCNHEEDKNYLLYSYDLTDLLPHKRCIKCGVFYK